MTELVGILNVTPDSFSDGGKFTDPEIAVAHARDLFNEGASIVDVGAESTRPGAERITPEEEWRRLEPVLRVLVPAYPGNISVDTHHPETVRKACSLGQVIINDVTGMNNPEMVRTVSKLKPVVIVSHLPGSDIQAAHRAADVSDVETVKNDLLEKARLLQDKGLAQDQIILDPGIGFGKNMELNWELLRFAELLPDYRVMIGHSRKRFLGPERMDLTPNLEAGRIAIAHGAAYLRVHDIAGHIELLNSQK